MKLELISPSSGAPSRRLPVRVEKEGEPSLQAITTSSFQIQFFMEKISVSDPFGFEDLLLSMPSLVFHVRARHRAGTREVTAQSGEDEGLPPSNRPRKQEDLESNEYECLYPIFRCQCSHKFFWGGGGGGESVGVAQQLNCEGRLQRTNFDDPVQCWQGCSPPRCFPTP
jgi:hypothetical protein